MSELNAHPATLPTAARSRKLTAAVIILAILPLALPFLFALFWQGIYPGEPAVEAHLLQQCASFECVKQGLLTWEQLGWLFILGPSILAALAPILLGTIGLIRARRHPTSPKNRALFRASLICGIVLAILFGCSLGAILYIAAVVGISN